jgi:hypothetical protein
VTCDVSYVNGVYILSNGKANISLLGANNEVKVSGTVTGKTLLLDIELFMTVKFTGERK